MHKITSLLLALCCLTVGLLTPHLTSVIQDAQFERQTYPLSDTAHYAYRGTLLNRVLALSAHMNHSPAVNSTQLADGILPEDLQQQLSAFLPIPEESVVHQTDALIIMPRQYSAEYCFTQIEYRAESLTLHVTIDAETQLPVYIELHTSPEIMTEYARSNSMWHILQEYAGMLNLGEAADDGSTTISEVLRSQEASLRGAPFTVSVTLIPSAGTLLLKLKGVPSA